MNDTDSAGPAPSDHPSLQEAEQLLIESAMVNETADVSDLGALARQAELLANAHDRLTAALDDAGRG